MTRRKQRLTLVVLFVAGLTVGTSNTTDSDAAATGTVWGSVRVANQPIVGAEVVLTGDSPRYACTDANGEFAFPGVPFDTDLRLATGVGSPERCPNYRFFAPHGGKLLNQAYANHDGVPIFDVFRLTADGPNFIVDFTARPPTSGERVCGGYLATLIGTPGDDFLRGGDDIDIIVGGRGNDVIHGRKGNDYLCGGLGRDRIYGEFGADWISGGPGVDTLLRGGWGRDVILGGSGRDSVSGYEGNDVVWGFAGNDQLSGGNGRDIIRAHGGDDFLKGGRGPDVLIGGAGQDTARGGYGTDECDAEIEVRC